jgi:hypothetical protein
MMPIKAYRCGESNNNWSDDPYHEKLSNDSVNVCLDFKLPSKGGGVTKVGILIQPDSFVELATTMTEVNTSAACQAFAAAQHKLFQPMISKMLQISEFDAIKDFAYLLIQQDDKIIRSCGEILAERMKAKRRSVARNRPETMRDGFQTESVTDQPFPDA